MLIKFNMLVKRLTGNWKHDARRAKTCAGPRTKDKIKVVLKIQTCVCIYLIYELEKDSNLDGFWECDGSVQRERKKKNTYAILCRRIRHF